ncbi:MAG: glycosyltransferase family 2 protein [Planctomycetota bacterium]|jgi:dolichol-phosphate mannosyltransferase
MRFLVAIPVHNEEQYVDSVLTCAKRFADEILVVNDGSTDKSGEKARAQGVEVIDHPTNYGYGRALRTAFEYAAEKGYEILITADADKQHPPRYIPVFLYHMRDYDIVSGSRYLSPQYDNTPTMPERARVNRIVTRAVNGITGYGLTDAFCGYKAYRVASLERLALHEDGYAMPLELWIQAAKHGLTVKEIPVSLIYLDPNRSFGGDLDNHTKRLAHYRHVIRREAERAGLRFDERPVTRCPWGDNAVRCAST